MAQTFNTGERGGNLHKDGIYQAEIQDAEVTTAQSSGNVQIKMQLVILKNGRPSGNMVMDYVTMTEAAEWRWKQLMDALDAPSNTEIDPETWLPGKRVYVRLNIEEYNDEDRNKVRAFLSEARAQKLLAKEAEAGGVVEPMANDSGAKAKQRNRNNSNAPELSAEEKMPL